MLVGTLLGTGISYAKSFPAELTMGNGQIWKGNIVRRDGDWIEFNKNNATRSVRVGASTVKEMKFAVALDAEKVSKMIRDGEFETAIKAIDDAIAPFGEYSDIPSNLSRYNSLLMELLYRTGKYEDSLAISSKIVNDGRSPELQEKARVYQALALVDTGKIKETEELFSKYGWDLDPTGDDVAPEKLYIVAKYRALKKEYNRAMEYAAKVVAFHSQDPDWIQPAELLCAQVYTELGLYDSAEEVCREILLFYKNTPEFDAATRLKIKIEKLRAEQRMKNSLQPE
jgi:tetratricopeptide (TPR) repeat protein